MATGKPNKILTAEQVIQEHRGLLYYIIRPIVADRDLEDDCFSEITELVIRNFDKYDQEKGNLTAWLTTVARNGAINFVKAKKHQVLAGDAPEEETFAGVTDGETPESIFLRKESALELQRAIRQLKTQEITIVLRKYYYHQGNEQIAAEMGMSVRAVEGKLYRIRKKLLQFMEQQEKGGAGHDR